MIYLMPDFQIQNEVLTSKLSSLWLSAMNTLVFIIFISTALAQDQYYDPPDISDSSILELLPRLGRQVVEEIYQSKFDKFFTFYIGTDSNWGDLKETHSWISSQWSYCVNISAPHCQHLGHHTLPNSDRSERENQQ